MHKHKLIELQKIIEVRIGTLTEEVEVATNVKLNPLYIMDRKDKIEISTVDNTNYQMDFRSGYRRATAAWNKQNTNGVGRRQKI